MYRSIIYNQLTDGYLDISTWIRDTFEITLGILMEFLGRFIDLAIAISQLIFQVICFLRDLCIETMQTFANLFRGIVNVVKSISSENVEDFAEACLVVILWVAAAKFFIGLVDKSYGRYNPLRVFKKLRNNELEKYESEIPAVRDHIWTKAPNSKRKSILRKKRSTKY
ncbi:uncharacterized protein LOC103580955 [Microplitis demolitor]|uniref:uncharacterized protein LOC103580955 n=1 Tax=Microplitis demolitor TaxID=69319 RepID=UPI0004CD44DB|nr:uncharacterized protein LOC103580955 [Microplitis demolitor]